MLFVTEISPFPPNSGERIRSNNLIRSAIKFCDTLFLIAGSAPPENIEFKKIVYVDYPILHKFGRWRNLASLVKKNKDLLSVFKNITDTHQIDLVWLDYNFLGQYIGFFKRRGIHVIYGTHNIQSKLNYQYPVKSLADFVYKNVRLILEHIHEQYFFSKADAIVAVSNEDLKFYKKHFRRIKLYMIPNYIHEDDYQADGMNIKHRRVIMSGNFRAFQNRVGLSWFLNNVWDEELAKMGKFVLVGHGSAETLDELKHEMGEFVNVEAVGSVPIVNSWISESMVAVIPLLHGSGTRLKCIEAMALKTNIVATSIGVEGIQHEGAIRVHDDAEGFREELVRALEDKLHHEEDAYTVFMKYYSSKSNTPLVQRMFEELLSPVNKIQIS